MTDDGLACLVCAYKSAFGRNIIINNRILKGIALILFGILLCIGGGEINKTILHSVGDFPFTLLGLIIGIVGLVMAFRKDTDK